MNSYLYYKRQGLSNNSEFLERIFLFLPSRILLNQCISVCKAWHSAIINKSFFKKFHFTKFRNSDWVHYINKPTRRDLFTRIYKQSVCNFLGVIQCKNLATYYDLQCGEEFKVPASLTSFDLPFLKQKNEDGPSSFKLISRQRKGKLSPLEALLLEKELDKVEYLSRIRMVQIYLTETHLFVKTNRDNTELILEENPPELQMEQLVSSHLKTFLSTSSAPQKAAEGDSSKKTASVGMKKIPFRRLSILREEPKRQNIPLGNLHSISFHDVNHPVFKLLCETMVMNPKTDSWVFLYLLSQLFNKVHGKELINLATNTTSSTTPRPSPRQKHHHHHRKLQRKNQIGKTFFASSSRTASTVAGSSSVRNNSNVTYPRWFTNSLRTLEFEKEYVSRFRYSNAGSCVGKIRFLLISGLDQSHFHMNDLIIKAIDVFDSELLEFLLHLREGMSDSDRMRYCDEDPSERSRKKKTRNATTGGGEKNKVNKKKASKIVIGDNGYVYNDEFDDDDDDDDNNNSNNNNDDDDDDFKNSYKTSFIEKTNVCLEVSDRMFEHDKDFSTKMYFSSKVYSKHRRYNPLKHSIFKQFKKGVKILLDYDYVPVRIENELKQCLILASQRSSKKKKKKKNNNNKVVPSTTSKKQPQKSTRDRRSSSNTFSKKISCGNNNNKKKKKKKKIGMGKKMMNAKKKKNENKKGRSVFNPSSSMSGRESEMDKIIVILLKYLIKKRTKDILTQKTLWLLFKQPSREVQRYFVQLLHEKLKRDEVEKGILINEEEPVFKKLLHVAIINRLERGIIEDLYSLDKEYCEFRKGYRNQQNDQESVFRSLRELPVKSKMSFSLLGKESLSILKMLKMLENNQIVFSGDFCLTQRVNKIELMDSENRKSKFDPYKFITSWDRGRNIHTDRRIKFDGNMDNNPLFFMEKYKKQKGVIRRKKTRLRSVISNLKMKKSITILTIPIFTKNCLTKYHQELDNDIICLVFNCHSIQSIQDIVKITSNELDSMSKKGMKKKLFIICVCDSSKKYLSFGKALIRMGYVLALKHGLGFYLFKPKQVFEFMKKKDCKRGKNDCVVM